MAWWIFARRRFLPEGCSAQGGSVAEVNGNRSTQVRAARMVAAGIAVAVVVTGCSPSGATNGGRTEPSPPDSVPVVDLTAPGNARRAIDELTVAAAGAPVVRVRISKNRASLTYVDDLSRPESLVWTNGQITTTDEGTDFVVSSSFDPAAFNLDKVAQMFEQAAQIAKSHNRQELQISEYNHERVLMTVTTTPESATVFFRADASVIYPLDFTTYGGIRDGLREAVGTSQMVLGIGVSEKQIWVDVPGSASGTIERRLRPPAVPVISTLRSQSTKNRRFDAALVDPDVIGQLVNELPIELGKPNANVTLLIQQQSDAAEPHMVFDVGGTTVTTTLAGKRVHN